MFDADRRLQEFGLREWTLFAAMAFGTIGATFAVTVLAVYFDVNVLDASSSGWRRAWPYVVSAGVSGAIAGGVAWSRLVEKPTNASDPRGFAVGAVAMLATQVLMFVIPVALGFVTGWSRPVLSPLPGDDAGDVGLYVRLSLFLLGPITLPVAGLVGRAFGRRRRRQIGGRRTFDLGEYVDGLSPRGWTVFAATTFGIGAALAALLVSLVFVGGLSLVAGIVFGFLLAPAAGLGGFAVGGVLWGFFVEVREKVSGTSGALVGAMTGLLTHFVVPIARALFLGGLPLNSLASNGGLIDQAISSGSFTLAVGGAITVPAGAYIGWWLALRRQGTIASSPPRATDDATTE